jgi:4-hydroxy-tetrahydrodipicolinate synthase
MTRFPGLRGGSLTALVTPFRTGIRDWLPVVRLPMPDGPAVDLPVLARLCERQIEAGTAGLVVCGSTGEAASLSPAEQRDVIATAVRVARGRVPVIAGCAAPATAGAVALAHEARRAGAAALLCAPPPYVKPTQEGIFAHVRAVSHAADLPVMLYDVPARTGTAISDETVARLFRDGLIGALKDAAGDLSRPPRLRALAGEGLLLFSGDDATAAAYRAMGGAGCVSVTANIAPALCTQLHAAWEERDLTAFARLRDLLDPLHAALFAETNPIPVKAALEQLGLCDGLLRLPLTRAGSATRERLARVLGPALRAERAEERRQRYALAG